MLQLSTININTYNLLKELSEMRVGEHKSL